jgi:hypothetical protein
VHGSEEDTQARRHGFVEYEPEPHHRQVVKKQTRTTRIKRHKVAASADNPEYIVESDRSGKRAAHKRKALKKV